MKHYKSLTIMTISWELKRDLSKNIFKLSEHRQNKKDIFDSLSRMKVNGHMLLFIFFIT